MLTGSKKQCAEQVTDDGSVQYEPRLDTRDLPGSGDERLGSDHVLPSIQRVSGSSESDIQTVPFEPQLALPDHQLQVTRCIA